MGKEYVSTIYIAVDLGYLIETVHGYRITEKGNNHLDLLLNPDILPQTNAIKKQRIKYHIGTCIVKILQTDWAKLIITGLIVLLFGTWLLVHYHVIHWLPPLCIFFGVNRYVSAKNLKIYLHV